MLDYSFIDSTIQSQYSASFKIKTLVRAFYTAITPKPDIALFYDNAFNVDSAQGVGLDVWGRIVAIPRALEGIETDGSYFGFNPITPPEDIEPFDQAPFYSDAKSNTYILSDNAYRLLIKTKAAANISTGSMAELNRLVSMLLPNKDVSVIHVDTMKLRILVEGHLEPYERNLLTRGDLPPIPAGVGWEVMEVPPPIFGFDGSGFEPFNQGTFYQGNIQEVSNGSI